MNDDTAVNRQSVVGLVTTLCMVATCAVTTAIGSDVRVTTDHPGANVIVESVEGDTVTLRPDLRDTEGWWFYWNFRASAQVGRTVTFTFAGNNPIGTRGPAVSTDDSRSWSYMGLDVVKDQSFNYTFTEDNPEARFAFAIPYLQSDLERFLARHKSDPHLVVETLCTTAKSRPVERLRLGKFTGQPPYRILLTARHHACESIANYSLEGLLGRVLSDTETGRWFRTNVEILAIPFMDKDGVEGGDQGKNRKPRDHNRDYIGESVHRETAALRECVPTWSGGRLRLALDLHCPYIRGTNNETIYMVGSSDPNVWAQQQRFGRILEDLCSGPLPYRVADNLPYGQSWNTGANYTQGRSFSRWAAMLGGVGLSSTFEIPYANVGEATVTAEAARAFGEDLAEAIRRYLQTLDEDR